MTRVGRGTPTTSETDCESFCTSAMSASIRLGQSGTLCMSNIMDCTVRDSDTAAASPSSKSK